jgi:anti-anti-sigma factor
MRLVVSEPMRASAGMLEIAVERDGGTGSISLAGELDRSQAGRLEEHLQQLVRDRPIENLILDMEGLRSIDPEGLNVIRSAWLDGSRSGIEMLVRASTDVRLALEQSGLDQVLPVVYICPDQRVAW